MLVVHTFIILIIIYILIQNNKVVESFTEIEVDTLKFSKTEVHPKIKNRPIYSFPLPLPMEEISPPHKNSSRKVKKELRYLEKLGNQKKARESRLLCERIEKHGILKMFLSLAGRSEMIYDAKHLRRVAKDAQTLAYLLKSYYNRPRPYQLGFLLGIRINPITLSDSSSYPCEHTLVSRIIADQLARNNPDQKKNIYSLAKKIELAKYYGGLNYPSDTLFSHEVADILKNRIRFLKI